MQEEAAPDFEESCAIIAEALAGDPAEEVSLEPYKARFEAQRGACRRKQETA